MTTLSLVVPCYNSAAYLERCLDSLPYVADVEVLVVDDGSTDETAAIADRYEKAHPGIVRVISQANGGHGAAINTGLAHATGQYLKVVDSDDWLDQACADRLLDVLRSLAETPVDLVVTNYVYEKAGRRRRVGMRFKHLIPEGRRITWDDVRPFPRTRYMLMHALCYRTDLLRECGLVLPEHTFYVDNLYAFIPLSWTRTLYYLDADLYRYYIGRSDQSVNEQVMISRIDQQLSVNRAMLQELNTMWRDQSVPEHLRRYLYSYAECITMVSSILMLRSATPENLVLKDALWAEMTDESILYSRLRRGWPGRLVNLPGRGGRALAVGAYRLASRIWGFN